MQKGVLQSLKFWYNVRKFKRMKHPLLLILALALYVYPCFSQEKELLKTEKTTEDATEQETAPDGEIRTDLAIRTNTTTDINQPNIVWKVYGDYMIPIKRNRLFVNGLLGYHWPLTFDAGIAYPAGKKDCWVAPRLGFLVGTHFGMSFGLVSKIEVKKFKMFTQVAFVSGFTKQRDQAFLLMELTYRPIKLIEIGIEPEIRVHFEKNTAEMRYEKEVEIDFELSAFIRFHINQGFFGVGYEFEPIDIPGEKIEDISFLKLTLGGEIFRKDR